MRGPTTVLPVEYPHPANRGEDIGYYNTSPADPASPVAAVTAQLCVQEAERAAVCLEVILDNRDSVVENPPRTRPKGEPSIVVD